MTTAARPKAPTSCETSDLDCTHITCGACDRVEPWPAGEPLGAWSCEWCGDEGEPVFEHHSPRPLGFRDDKRCHWSGITLGDLVVPEAWIYYAMEPTA